MAKLTISEGTFYQCYGRHWEWIDRRKEAKAEIAEVSAKRLRRIAFQKATSFIRNHRWSRPEMRLDEQGFPMVYYNIHSDGRGIPDYSAEGEYIHFYPAE